MIRFIFLPLSQIFFLSTVFNTNLEEKNCYYHVFVINTQHFWLDMTNLQSSHAKSLVFETIGGLTRHPRGDAEGFLNPTSGWYLLLHFQIQILQLPIPPSYHHHSLWLINILKAIEANSMFLHLFSDFSIFPFSLSLFHAWSRMGDQMSRVPKQPTAWVWVWMIEWVGGIVREIGWMIGWEI